MQTPSPEHAPVLKSWIDLTPRARWQLSGADRVRYLNGQVTRDVRKITPGRAALACVLDPKGRLMGDVWISATADFLRIDAELVLRDSLGARLERYIIADDAELVDVTDATAQFHLLGMSAERLLAKFGDAVQVLASTRLGEEGLDVFCARDRGQEVSGELAREALRLTDKRTEVLRIERGLPHWGDELLPETLPAEAGLDATAIDFAKGCYLGQEVVSRIRSVGHVNKQLAGFAPRDGEPLEVGTKLYASAEAEREAAWITSATWSFALSRPIALGYLRRGTAAAVLQTRQPGKAAREVEIHALPFAPVAPPRSAV